MKAEEENKALVREAFERGRSRTQETVSSKAALS
jgi:hypothetical protein